MKLKEELMKYFNISDTDTDAIQRLSLLIYLAEREVLKRAFPFGEYTDKDEAYILEKYDYVVFKAVMRDYSRIGAEGESSHSENGTSRSYISDDSVFNDIIPMCKIV